MPKDPTWPVLWVIFGTVGPVCRITSFSSFVAVRPVGWSVTSSIVKVGYMTVLRLSCLSILLPLRKPKLTLKTIILSGIDRWYSKPIWCLVGFLITWVCLTMTRAWYRMSIACSSVRTHSCVVNSAGFSILSIRNPTNISTSLKPWGKAEVEWLAKNCRRNWSALIMDIWEKG